MSDNKKPQPKPQPLKKFADSVRKIALPAKQTGRASDKPAEKK